MMMKWSFIFRHQLYFYDKHKWLALVFVFAYKYTSSDNFFEILIRVCTRKRINTVYSYVQSIITEYWFYINVAHLVVIPSGFTAALAAVASTLYLACSPCPLRVSPEKEIIKLP